MHLAYISFVLLVFAGCARERFEGSEPGDCTDDADNDADGLFDCDDSGCAGAAACEVAENTPPKVVSEPSSPFELSLALPSNFNPQQVYISSSRTDEVRVYNTTDLAFITSFTHPAFGEPASGSFQYGPNGMAFNERGHLVVAAHTKFVEFSDYGTEYATYPKVTEEATENLLFDRAGNLYTTTATGGSDKLNQYRAIDYSFMQTITLPAGAGQLTGITFDNRNRLYVASQSDNTIHVAVADSSFTSFTWVDAFSGADNPGQFEGLQFNSTGDLVAAAGDLVIYNVTSGERIGVFDAPTDAYPVPVRVDNEGFIYTADYENGRGTAPADIFKFSPDGSSHITANDPALYGPFGAAISGTILAGDPPVEFVYQVEAIDSDGDELTFSLLEGPVDMVINPTTGMLSWWVTSVHIGSHLVSVQVDDGHGGVDTQTFTLEIVGT